METRRLGTIEVSAIGMGCMGLSHGYGEIPPEDYSIEAVRRAFEAGCTFFDTAEAYGPNLAPENLGHNEKIVGAALTGVRERAVIATKLHLSAEEMASRGVYDTVRTHLEASLERLQTSYADLYYLHRVNLAVPLEDVAAAMGRLIDEGLVRGWGLSQVGVERIAAAHAVCPLSAVQNIYSMVERGVEAEVIPWCLDHGIGIVPFSPVASGLLSGKLTASTDFSHSDDVRKFVPQLSEKNLEANRPIVELVQRTAAEKGATPAQVSLAWMLHKWPNVVPIPGSKNQGRILENLGAADVHLTEREFAELDRALEALPVAGHRGFEQVEGAKMSDWGKR